MAGFCLSKLCQVCKKHEHNVTEDLSLVPISTYNKTKIVAERVFLSYSESMHIHCIRPATVCGLAPRMRLDVSVNMLTHQALKNGVITVFGGQQTRPNIHIRDMINVYRHLLNNPRIESGCYNTGFENMSIIDIAKMVSRRIEAEIQITDSNDSRSYRQDSTKLLNTSFVPKFTVNDAIEEITEAYKNGLLTETESCYTVKWMKKLELGS